MAQACRRCPQPRQPGNYGFCFDHRPKGGAVDDLNAPAGGNSVKGGRAKTKRARAKAAKKVIKYRGVYRAGRKWQAQIGYGGSNMYLGTYETAVEAVSPKRKLNCSTFRFRCLHSAADVFLVILGKGVRQSSDEISWRRGELAPLARFGLGITCTHANLVFDAGHLELCRGLCAAE